MHLKQITENSWILKCLDNTLNENFALITESKNNKILLIAKDGNVVSEFPSRKDLEDFFGVPLFSNIKNSDATTSELIINGYPTGVNLTEEIEIVDHDAQLFKKSPASKVIFCAGFYCIQFTTGWVLNLSPKKTTLDKYEHRGPYKTEFEAKSVLSTLKKEQ